MIASGCTSGSGGNADGSAGTSPSTGSELPLGPRPPLQQMHRSSSMLRVQLNRGATRKQSFLVDLQEQMQRHRQEDVDREKLREIQNLHRILQRPPETRDATDIDTLYDWVLRNGSTNKIFQGAQEIICKTICREMTLLELPAKGAVCYQGDYGDVFFIIIHGSVSLYVETKKKAPPPPPTNSHHTNSSSSSSTSTNTNSTSTGNSSDDNRPPERFRLKRLSTGLDSESDNGEIKPEMFGALIKQIGAGGTFGELAVMDPTARRSCTILCDVATSFICLKRAAYQRLIRITNSTQLDFTQVEFLETLYFFDRWPHSELMRVSNRLRHMSFPADSYLAKISSEANLVFFIYSGIVQESIPLVHHLNENGNVFKSTTLESDAALRISLHDHARTDPKQKNKNKQKNNHQQRRRVALEVNLYQDHDICGELPIVFNKPSSNTDLLAVTDVKALIMDRETWREVFFMHGLEHVKESHRRFRQVAQSRESWRQTRLKLELANPGLHITLSTKAMMQDGKCLCGWCGSSNHTTGDGSCPALLASKQRQADKQKKKESEKSSPTGKKIKNRGGATGGGGGGGGGGRGGPAIYDGIAGKAHVVKNTLTFVNQLADTASSRRASELVVMAKSSSGLLGSIITGTVATASRPTTPHAPTSPNDAASRSSTPRQLALRAAAQKIICEKPPTIPTLSLEKRPESDQPLITPLGPGLSPSRPLCRVSEHLAIESNQNIPTPQASPQQQKSRGTSDLFGVYRAARGERHPEVLVPSEPLVLPTKVEEIRKSAFPEALSAQYRHELIRSTKRITKVQQFFDTRGKVLESVQNQGTLPAEHRYQHACNLPRKPKIPKPSRRLAMLSKNHEPKPDRFNRKINRMLKKMWDGDHPMPVVEESLRDS